MNICIVKYIYLIFNIIIVVIDRLIKHRRKQSNFQLVVITHDESFVQQIGKSEFASYYYRISKDAKYVKYLY